MSADMLALLEKLKQENQGLRREKFAAVDEARNRNHTRVRSCARALGPRSINTQNAHCRPGPAIVYLMQFQTKQIWADLLLVFVNRDCEIFTCHSTSERPYSTTTHWTRKH